MSTINPSLVQSGNDKKDDTISMCKGIAILLMVMAHGGVCMRVAAFIAMFHMPIFFFFSGFCLKPSYLEQPMVFINRRIKGLYLPYVKWMFLFILLHNFFCELGILDPQSVGLYNWGQMFEKLARTAFTFVGGEQLLGGFWFLRELFWGSLIAFFMLKYMRNKYLVLSVSLVAALFFHLTAWHIPSFGIGYTTFMASSYFITGFIFKTLSVNVLRPFLIFLSYAAVFIGSLFWNFDDVSESTLLVIPYFMTAIIGVWATYSLCRMFNTSSYRFFIWVGNNTMPILTWHFLSFKLVSLFIIVVYRLPLSRLSDFPYIKDNPLVGGWILYFMIGSLFPLFLDLGWKKICKRIVNC